MGRKQRGRRRERGGGREGGGGRERGRGDWGEEKELDRGRKGTDSSYNVCTYSDSGFNVLPILMAFDSRFLAVVSIYIYAYNSSKLN